MRKAFIGVGLLAAGVLLVGSSAGELDGIGGMSAEIIAGGVSMGTFTALSSPSFEVEVIEVVMPPDPPRKVPGKVRVGTLRFEMGTAAGAEIAAWRAQVQNPGGPQPAAIRNGEIIVRDDTGTEVARWAFENGWPSRLEGFKTARAGFMGRVVDVMELTVDRLVRVEPPAEGGKK